MIKENKGCVLMVDWVLVALLSLVGLLVFGVFVCMGIALGKFMVSNNGERK